MQLLHYLSYLLLPAAVGSIVQLYWQLIPSIAGQANVAATAAGALTLMLVLLLTRI